MARVWPREGRWIVSKPICVVVFCSVFSIGLVSLKIPMERFFRFVCFVFTERELEGAGLKGIG